MPIAKKFSDEYDEGYKLLRQNPDDYKALDKMESAKYWGAKFKEKIREIEKMTEENEAHGKQLAWLTNMYYNSPEPDREKYSKWAGELREEHERELNSISGNPDIDRFLEIALKEVGTNCFALQLKENANLPAMKSQLAQTQKEIDNVMNAIKQGIITPTTKSTLEALEAEKESLEIAIAKEQIERPILSKEQIKYWICKFRFTNVDLEEQKKRLIDVFINAIYVYDDKVLATFHYKDGEICATFDEINEMLAQKENADNLNDYQRSPLNKFGDPSAIRTPDTLIKSPTFYVLCSIIWIYVLLNRIALNP